MDDIEWLNKQQGACLVSDDEGRWAVSGDGLQDCVPEGGFTETTSITTWVDPEYWKPSILEAIAFYRAQVDTPDESHFL